MTDNEEMKSSIIETIDEHGNSIKFELIDVIEVEEKSYGLLYPLQNEDDEEGMASEAVVMRLIQEGEDYVFEQIEDDTEFERIEKYIQSLQEDL